MVLSAWLLLGTTLAGATPSVGVEAGLQGGLALQDANVPSVDVPVRVGGVLTPRLAVFVGPTVGLELDVPLEIYPGPDGGIRSVGPRLTFLAEPSGGRMAGQLRLGVGVLARSWAFNFDMRRTRWAVEAHVGAALVVPVLGALRVRIQPEWTASFVRDDDGDMVFVPGVTLTAGIGTRFDRRADADRDRVLDALDACPEVAEDFDEWQDEDGCPEPDNDMDGVRDPLDGCPNEAEDLDGDVDEDGCPE